MRLTPVLSFGRTKAYSAPPSVQKPVTAIPPAAVETSLNRRQFLTTSTLALAGAALLSQNVVGAGKNLTPDALNRMLDQYRRASQLPEDSIERRQLKATLEPAWKDLRQQAVKGDKTARRFLQALCVNLMVDELNTPHPERLLRFEDETFDTLLLRYREQKLDKTELLETVQERAIWGLCSFFRFNASDNPFLKITPAFYQPVAAIMNNSADVELLEDACDYLEEIYDALPDSLQENYFQSLTALYLGEAPLARKHAALGSLYYLSDEFAERPGWHKLMEAVFARLKQQVDSRSFNLAVEDTVLLGLLQDKSVLEFATSEQLSQTPPRFQQAIVWTLGRPALQSAQAFNTLAGIIRSNFPLQTKTMALQSLTEYGAPYSRHIHNLLEKAVQTDSGLQDAVASVSRKLSDKAHFKTKNFSINTMLSTERERQRYIRVRDHFFPGFDQLSTEKKNHLDQSFIPFYPYLEALPKTIRHDLTEGMVTNASVFRPYIGIRLEDGRLTDTLPGLTFETLPVTSTSLVNPYGAPNTAFHETWHVIQDVILKKQESVYKQITRLWGEALNEKKLLSYYSAREEEFIPETAEIFQAWYRSHRILYEPLLKPVAATAGNFTRFDLKDRHPALFNFFQHLQNQKTPLNIQ